MEWRMADMTILRQCSHLMPWHGAWGRYSLGTNVNTPFFQVRMPKFWLVTVGRVQGRDLVLGHFYIGRRISVWLLCPLVPRQFITSNAAHNLQFHSCFKMASNRAKRSKCLHRHLSATEAGYPYALVLGQQWWTARNYYWTARNYYLLLHQ